MENKELELRMYFFVPYNISPIQQAIQAGHAALEYAFYYGNDKIFETFLKNHKTWIILNGGTTNDTIIFSDPMDSEGMRLGTLNQIEHELQVNRIQYTRFCEPDLNNALTALCFICDEKVFNKKDYFDFVDYIMKLKMYPDALTIICLENMEHFRKKSNRELQGYFPEYYDEWVEYLGGEKNVFLRSLLKDKKLA